MLLLGPTGSGKTPLGELAQRRGLWQRRCLHFDFGATLRALVARDHPTGPITQADIQFLRGVLQSGALLEDAEFALAQRVFAWFLDERRASPETLVVLNGLPRHLGQAEAMEPIVDIRAVVCLECSPGVVLARIRSNVGGDRAGREDDDPHSIQEKLALFHRRTAPLLAYYRARSVPIWRIEVTEAMTPEAMWDNLVSVHGDGFGVLGDGRGNATVPLGPDGREFA